MGLALPSRRLCYREAHHHYHHPDAHRSFPLFHRPVRHPLPRVDRPRFL
jgi:hypothetical protein